MNIVETEVRSVRLDQKTNHTHANVTFYVSGGMGDRCDVMNFECRCKTSIDGTMEQKLSHVERGLIADALRQANAMPEFRSGDDNLKFLTPLEHTKSS